MKNRNNLSLAMKTVSMAIMALCAVAPHTAAVDIPSPPDVGEIAALVSRPDGDCNAADAFLEAEALYRKTELKKAPEKRNSLSPDSEIMKQVERGLACKMCEFPFSRDMKLPPYEQMIPMMALYRAAARTWRIQGDEALERKDYPAAEAMYAKALNLGLLLFEEPGITIIQDMISFACMQEGAEGLGDVFIATHEADKAAACARFLANRARYMDSLPKFVSRVLRGPDHPFPGLTDDFKAIALLYPSITYAPVKVEIILCAGELHAFNRKDPELVKHCRMILDRAMNDPDERLRKMAKWALEWDIGDYVEMLKDQGVDIDKDMLKEVESMK